MNDPIYRAVWFALLAGVIAALLCTLTELEVGQRAAIVTLAAMGVFLIVARRESGFSHAPSPP